MFIGIALFPGRRLITFAMLDARLKILRLDKIDLTSLIESIRELPSAVCGIGAPVAPGKRLMADPGYRLRLGIEPRVSAYDNYRVCEYELRRRKIALSNTPASADLAPRWMQEGWRLYDALRQDGYVEYPRTGARRMFETFPQAGFTALIKKKPYPKSGVEGLLQRQLILYQEGIDVPDPMTTLEEWTRHRIMVGEISRRNLYDHYQLDAIMAAYVAFKVDREPDQVLAVGDPLEGQIVVPVRELLESY